MWYVKFNSIELFVIHLCELNTFISIYYFSCLINSVHWCDIGSFHPNGEQILGEGWSVGPPQSCKPEFCAWRLSVYLIINCVHGSQNQVWTIEDRIGGNLALYQCSVINQQELKLEVITPWLAKCWKPAASASRTDLALWGQYITHEQSLKIQVTWHLCFI